MQLYQLPRFIDEELDEILKVLKGDKEIKGISKEDLEEFEPRFRAKGLTIPIVSCLHFNFNKRFRLGLGLGVYIHRAGTFLPITKLALPPSLALEEYIPPQPTYYSSRPFLNLGFKFFDNEKYAALVDTSLGYDLLHKSYKDLFKFSSYIERMIVYSIGLRGERSMTPFLDLFAKVGYELHTWPLSIGGELPKSDTEIIGSDYCRTSFHCLLGISFKKPQPPAEARYHVRRRGKKFLN